MQKSLLAAAAACILTASSAAAQRADSAAMIVRFGTDTLAVERWVRTADELHAVSVTRSPRTTVRRWSVRLAPDGTVTHVAAASGPMTPVAREGVIPTAGGFYAPQALALAYASHTRDSLVVVPMLSGANPITMRVRRAGPDSFEILNSAGVATSRARLTNDGRLLFLESGSTTVERVAWFDIDALAREFEARDARGAGLGPLSTRDTARATVAGANLALDYGRPAARGRTIFGGLVPWGRVWRAGADDPTTLIVDRAVRVGAVRLEPGSYALYTVPERERWVLGINRGTGMEVAMAPAAEQDVGRTNMTVRTLPEYVERFTIRLDPTADGALLRMQWENTEATVPIVVER